MCRIPLQFVCVIKLAHVEHVHKLRISVEVRIRKNFATLGGFGTQCHVTSP